MWVASSGVGGAAMVGFIGWCAHDGGGCGWQWVLVVVDFGVLIGPLFQFMGLHFMLVFFPFYLLGSSFLVEFKVAIMVVMVW